MLCDLSGWVDASDIIWDTTFNVSRTLNSTAGGINFATRVENNSSNTQTVAMNLSGGKFGATGIELNPVNGDLVINGPFFNDYSLSYNIWGNTGRTLTLNSTLGPNANQSGVAFTIQRNTTVVLNANQLWQGTTTLNGGNLRVGASGLLGNGTYSGAIVMNSFNGTNASLIFSNSAAQTLSGDLVIGTGSLTINGTGFVSSNRSFVGHEVGNSGTVSVSSGTWTNNILRIGNNGTASVTISGTGNVTSSDGSVGQLVSSNGTVNVIGGTWTNSGNLTIGSNNGTASVTINGTGTVIVGATLSRGANGAINLESGGTLQIGTGSTTGTLATNLTNNGTVIFNRSNDSTLSSNISGTGALTKNGSGNLTLSGANTYTGTTTINAGSIVLGANQTLGGIAGAGNIQLSNYTLTTSVAANLTFSGAISGTGALVKTGSGNLTLSGANTYSGGTILSAGKLIVNTASLPGDVANKGVLEFSQATNGTFLGNISGNGSLVKTGSGTVTLAGNNTYSGGTTVSSGTLEASAQNALGGTSSIDLHGGSLLVSASNAINDSASISMNGGTLAMAGSGTTENLGPLTLSENSTIDLGNYSGSRILRFADSSSVVWTNAKILQIWNWQGASGVGDRNIYFGNSSSGLGSNQLAQIAFYSDSGSSFLGTASIYNTGEIGYVPVIPEPEAIISAIILLIGGIVAYFKKRPRRLHSATSSDLSTPLQQD